MHNDDIRTAAKLGLHHFESVHAATSARAKLEAAEEQRQIRLLRADELTRARHAALVTDGWLSDDDLRRETLENQQDIEDFNILIEALKKHIAEEEAREQEAAANAKAAAEAAQRVAAKKHREKAAGTVDEALVALEVAVKAWAASHSDLPVVQQNRRPFYLRAAVSKLAPELARMLEVQRTPHIHQRPLAEVAL